jgi:hypothetical protein
VAAQPGELHLRLHRLIASLQILSL